MTRRRSRSMARTAARIFCPSRNRSLGWEMRETEMCSMGSMATIPQPMSRKAPKGSSRMTRQLSTLPGTRCARKKAMAFSWASRRLNRATGAPLASAEMLFTVKQVCLPTLDNTEISRPAPLIQGATASWRGIRPSTLPREKNSVRSVPQRLTAASKISPLSTASLRADREQSDGGRRPSGGKNRFSGIIDRILFCRLRRP